MGFPGGTVVKNSSANAGDMSSIPGSGRFPGEGNSNPLQYSCLENSMDRGAWWAMVHGVTKSWCNWACTHVCMCVCVSWIFKHFCTRRHKTFFNVNTGEGNGNPLQYSCLENPVDGEPWQATVHGISKSRTRLSNFTFFLLSLPFTYCYVLWAPLLGFFRSNFSVNFNL